MVFRVLDQENSGKLTKPNVKKHALKILAFSCQLFVEWEEEREKRRGEKREEGKKEEKREEREKREEKGVDVNALKRDCKIYQNEFADDLVKYFFFSLSLLFSFLFSFFFFHFSIFV